MRLKKIIFITMLIFIFSFSFVVYGYNEAPDLEEKVENGELQNVEDRLPPEPLEIDTDEIGQYGGTWNHGSLNADMGEIRMSIHYEPLFRWNRDNTETVPNLAEDWEYSDDYRELTIHLREGIKWSDGEDYTVDDFMFYWEDMAMDDDVPITAPHYYRGGGEWMEVEKIDDHTMVWKFEEPNHLTEIQSGWNCFESAAHQVPSHYMKEYHPKYNDDASYDELQARYEYPHRYENRPMLTAWVTKDYKDGEGAVFERNPYYWKVDSEGNQLPYIDEIDSEIYQDEEVLRLALQTGEIDFQARPVLYDLRHLPAVLQNQEEQNYTVELFKGDVLANPVVMLNYHHEDEDIQELFYEQKFRLAISHAIDRERINEIIHLGRGKIRQAAPMYPDLGSYNAPGGEELYEEWTNFATEYDPELAKEYLDDIGMVDQNNDGWRERPDGEEFEALIDVESEANTLIESLDLIAENWEEIGIKTSINTVTLSQLEVRKTDEFDEWMFHGRGPNSALGHIAAPDHWVPIDNTSYGIAAGYGRWYRTGGEGGIEPPEDSPLRELQKLYDKALQQPKLEDQYEYIHEAYKVHIEEGPLLIGTVGEEPKPVVINNNLKNTPEHMWLESWSFGQPGASNPEQFFFDN